MRSDEVLVRINEFSSFLATSRGSSPRTVTAYRSDVRTFALFLRSQEEPPQNEACKSLCQAFVGWLQSRPKNCPATIRRKLISLTLFFQWLVRNGHATYSPFEQHQIVVRVPKRLPRALARSDVAQLLAGAAVSSDAQPTIEIALRLLVSTGIRIGEMCATDATDVSSDGCAIRIRGKGDRERVAHIVNPSLQTQVVDLARKRLARGSQSSALFVSNRGRRLTPQTFRLHLHELAAREGLTTRVTPHRLRHTAATLLLEEGVDIRFLQRLLGHASIATTEIYTKVVDASLRAALARADLLRQL